MSSLIPVTVATETGNLEECSIMIESASPGKILLSSKSFGNLACSGHSLVECLRQLMLVLEKRHAKILCNGARIDAWASRLSREMSGGRKVYLVRMEQRPKPSDLVYIFGAAPSDKVGTLDQQRAFTKQWREGLKENEV